MLQLLSIHDSGDLTSADMCFRPEDSEIEMKYLEHGELAVIETIWGHVGGGGACEEDTKWMDSRIAQFLDGPQDVGEPFIKLIE